MYVEYVSPLRILETEVRTTVRSEFMGEVGLAIEFGEMRGKKTVIRLYSQRHGNGMSTAHARENVCRKWDACWKMKIMWSEESRKARDKFKLHSL